MKLIVAIILLFAPINDLNKIAKANEHKRAAKQAYLEEDYQTAAYHYQFLKDSLDVQEEEVLLNLANSLYKTQDSTSARNLYSNLLEGTSSKTRSQAHQQLGAMNFNSKEYEEALNHFKSALRTDPTNEDARYNYELLKKLLKEEEEQKQDQENQDQENQDQENQEDQQDKENQENQDQQNQEQQEQDSEQQENQENQQENQEGEEQEQQEQEDENSEEQQEQQEQQQPEEGEEESEPKEPTTADKLEEMNISEEKAQMILEAMKNNEIQYLQQNKRKAQKKKKSGKPDW
ncbi:MAG: tetratricopeptide repeat protein [Saprospiraceae bacterium]|nr:tetratricopeptide repeat protein [Saprospiraceae bacterium]